VALELDQNARIGRRKQAFLKTLAVLNPSPFSMYSATALPSVMALDEVQ
jgi:hypothetical protein